MVSKGKEEAEELLSPPSQHSASQVCCSGSGSQCGQRWDWNSGSEWQGGTPLPQGGSGRRRSVQRLGSLRKSVSLAFLTPISPDSPLYPSPVALGSKGSTPTTYSPPPSGDALTPRPGVVSTLPGCPRRFRLQFGLGPGGRASSASTYLLPVELTAVFVS